jgi:tricorn protease
MRKEEPYFFASTVLKENPVVENEHENYQAVYSPDGKEIAFIEDRDKLKVYNRNSKQVRTILTDADLFSMGDYDQYFTWSPDSKWLLVQYSDAGVSNDEIGIIAAGWKIKTH